MGFRNSDDYKLILNGGDYTANASANFLPSQQGQHGPFPDAFPDSVHAKRASEGLRILRDFTAFDPERNWVDALRPKVYDPPGFSVGITGDIYTAGSDTLSYSGGKSIWFRSAGPSTTAVEMQTPYFRIAAGRPYRVRVTWKSSASTASSLRIFVDQWNYDRSVYHAGPSGTFDGTNNVWRQDSYVFTTDEPDVGDAPQWGALRVKVLEGGQEVYLDELQIEPEPPSFRVYKTTDTTWDTGWQTIEFTSATYDYGNNIDTVFDDGIFVCRTPGVYHFDARAIFEAQAFTAGDRIACGLWLDTGGGSALAVRGDDDEVEVNATIYRAVGAHGDLALAAGDEVVFRVYHDNGANRSISGGEAECFMNGHLVR